MNREAPTKLKAPSFRLRKSAYADFSPGGRYLAQIGPRVTVWDLAARKVASEFKVISNEWDLAFSPDEETIAVKDSNGRIVICDVASGSVISDTGPSPVYGAGCKPLFMTDGKYLLDGSWDGDLRILEVASAKVVDQHSFGKVYSLGSLIASPASARVFAAFRAKSGQRGGSRLLAFELQVAMNRYEEILPVTKAQTEGRGWRELEHLVISPDGQSGAVFMLGATLETPNTIEAFGFDGTWSRTAVLESRQHHVRGLAWSASGFVVASIHENVKMDKPGFNAWLEAEKAGVYEHVHFYAAESLQLEQRWPWKGVWGIAIDAQSDALAIASKHQPGVCLAVSDWRPSASGVGAQ